MSVNHLEKKIIVAGIGPGNKTYTTPAALEKIQAAKFLLGGKRALSDFASENQETFSITSDLESALNFIREKILIDNVVVMVSGDPGYFSMLDLIRKNFSPSKIEVIPSISAMQLAFAKLSLSWSFAKLLSFHGRKPADEDLKFEKGKILGLLTDAEFNSKTISKILLEFGWEKNSDIAICSRLSYPDEKIILTTLEKAADSEPIKHCILIVGKNLTEIHQN
ncbi:MAG: precorrin-6y C5,15-methyltransferase (decarboxylating) subunit CbiE [Selenomonadaceae bacterium]|nr:precorrin-6y C5,15-methyltransferase (decarboxylating) subunit CbiE [Selenomonadaceae bacterium]